jgi:phospholipid transport system transporter-binding protein
MARRLESNPAAPRTGDCMKKFQEPSFQVNESGGAALTGTLSFASAGRLLPRGVASISSGQIRSVDLAAVAGADSAGLALLIEWLSVAKAAGKSLQYENVPAQLLQLAKLSDVEALLAGKTG